MCRQANSVVKQCVKNKTNFEKIETTRTRVSDYLCRAAGLHQSQWSIIKKHYLNSKSTEAWREE